ncbi:unnamed protein product [Chrysoparadoxa australica]
MESSNLTRKRRREAQRFSVRHFAGQVKKKGLWDSNEGGTAQFSSPQGIALALDGTIYIADSANHVVRRINAKGVTTYAGSGKPGLIDGPKLQASFNHPKGITVGPSGNVYVADTNNHAIRVIDTQGTVTTVVGTGEKGYQPGPVAADQCMLNSPAGCVVEATGCLLISDTDNNCLRRVYSNGTVTTAFGSRERGLKDGPAEVARFHNPHGLSIDSAGNVLVADTFNHAVRRISPNGEVQTIAGAGKSGFCNDMGAASKFFCPMGVAAGEDGEVFVCDTSNSRLRRVARDGLVETAAGSGVEGYADGEGQQAKFWLPTGIAYDPTKKRLYACDTLNSVVRLVERAGNRPVDEAPDGVSILSAAAAIAAEQLNREEEQARCVGSASASVPAPVPVQGSGSAEWKSGGSWDSEQSGYPDPPPLSLSGVTQELYVAPTHGHLGYRQQLSTSPPPNMRKTPPPPTKPLAAMMPPDVIFDVDGEKLGAHCSVLVAQSDYFRSMLGGAKEPGGGPLKVTVTYTSALAFKELLHYLYTKQLKFSEPALIQVLELSCQYGLDDVRTYCEEQIIERLHLSNAVQLFLYATDQHFPALRESSLECLARNVRLLRDSQYGSSLDLLRSRPNLLLDILRRV